MCIQWPRVLYSIVITWPSNPHISQFSRPCNEFTNGWSMLPCKKWYFCSKLFLCHIEYILQTSRMIHTHTCVSDSPVQIPVTWPQGTYGLMKTTNGCPGNNVDWEYGWLEQDTDDVNMNNTFSPDIQLYLHGMVGYFNSIALLRRFRLVLVLVFCLERTVRTLYHWATELPDYLTNNQSP